jgi:hypothetical protein
VKAKGKSSKDEARGRARCGSAQSREGQVTRMKKTSAQGKGLAQDVPVETTAEVRTDAAALARSIAQVAAVGGSQARERGPAPPMPVPIATFNI